MYLQEEPVVRPAVVKKEEYDTFMTPTITENSENNCPDCGTHLVYSGGCMICNGCGWSRCG